MIILIASCKDKKDKYYTVRQVGDLTIRGKFINDSVYDDTVKYYDLNDSLIAKSFFKDGKKEGLSTNYFPNGNIKATTYFKYGLTNGFHKVFDSSSGNLYYTDYYYYGLDVGPAIYYNENKSPDIFYFINLQNETLLTIDYNDWGGIKDVYKSCINFTTSKVDRRREIDLLLYLINPPKFFFKYSIIKKKKKAKDDFIETQSVTPNGDIPFIVKALPFLPDDENYCIGLNIYDSVLDKETTIYKDF